MTFLRGVLVALLLLVVPSVASAQCKNKDYVCLDVYAKVMRQAPVQKTAPVRLGLTDFEIAEVKRMLRKERVRRSLRPVLLLPFVVARL